MPNKNNNSNGEANEGTEPTTNEGAQTLTQEQIDNLINGRVAKYVSKVHELQSELDKLQGKYDKLDGEHNALTARVERERIVEEVSKETGVSRSIVETLSGDTKEALTVAAKAIADMVASASAASSDEGKNEQNTSSQAMYVPNLGYAPSKQESNANPDPVGQMLRGM